MEENKRRAGVTGDREHNSRIEELYVLLAGREIPKPQEGIEPEPEHNWLLRNLNEHGVPYNCP